MADAEHLTLIRGGARKWNDWRASHPAVKPDLSGAQLRRAKLRSIDLRDSNLSGAVLNGSDLSGASCSKAVLNDADLRDSNLGGSIFYAATLQRADCRDAFMRWADLSRADFTDANLTRADLRRTHLARTIFEGADLSGCSVYGSAAWNVQLDRAIQTDLIITEQDEPRVTCDDLEVAQFMYLLLNNQKLRTIIDSVTSKAVLLLGRFGERKEILDAIREALRKRDYLPILFDFDIPQDRDVTETIRTLAGLARFVVADLTEPASIPKELEAIVPALAVPVRPIIEGQARPFSMFADYWKYVWVVQEPFRYAGLTHLIENMDEQIIETAEAKVREVSRLRTRGR